MNGHEQHCNSTVVMSIHLAIRIASQNISARRRAIRNFRSMADLAISEGERNRYLGRIIGARREIRFVAQLIRGLLQG